MKREWRRLIRRFKRKSHKMSDFFFLDDMDEAKDYISVSIGEVWLYFYRETLIGVRDMRTNRAVFLTPAQNLKPDGYSHRHEITKDIVAIAVREPYPNSDPPRFLPAVELTAQAVEWVASGLVQHIDAALRA